MATLSLVYSIMLVLLLICPLKLFLTISIAKNHKFGLLESPFINVSMEKLLMTEKIWQKSIDRSGKMVSLIDIMFPPNLEKLSIGVSSTTLKSALLQYNC